MGTIAICSLDVVQVRNFDYLVCCGEWIYDSYLLGWSYVFCDVSVVEIL